MRKSHSVYWYCHSICGRRYNSPSAAAPGDVLHLVQNHYFFGLVQPVGFVDYEFLKKSIWRFFFSRRRLKEFTDDTEISSSDKLFRRFMTRWEKNCNRVLQRQWFFISYELWPLVILSSELWKKNVHEVEVKLLTILKISIKSALLRPSCKDHNPSD